GQDGVQISIGSPADGLKLRRPEVQRKYQEAAQAHGMAVHSIAMCVLNNVPLATEPKTALWVADTIDTAHVMGAHNILLAFFSKGELKEQNAEHMRRVTEVLQELAPRAEKARLIVGLETYLSAEAHLKILDAV